jgi:hypothetical protein
MDAIIPGPAQPPPDDDDDMPQVLEQDPMNFALRMMRVLEMYRPQLMPAIQVLADSIADE